MRTLRACLAAGLLAASSCSWHHATPQETVATELAALREAARSGIAEPQRAARAAAAIDGIAADLAAIQSAMAWLKPRLRTLNADPDADAAEFAGVLDGFDARRREIRTRLLDHHFQLVAATTPAEWHRLAPHERRALSASVQ